jgi:23S rRNA (cytidine1920-2'-O)/16S rRNA (cytidine1409-2'-O)-methyltransferase
MPKKRLDEIIFEREMVETIAEARARIMAGEIIVKEQRVDKAGTRFEQDVSIRVRGRKTHRYVSRGGLKLEHALTTFGLSVTDRICLDLGSSTGGFTDCLLQSGARRVYAVDVGYGLLDWALRGDSRVICLERTHAASLTRKIVPEAIDVLVADISFNSLTRLIPPVLPLIGHSALAILLIKPQFEAKRSQVGPGGIVADSDVHQQVCGDVIDAMCAIGAQVIGLTPSSIRGAHGNQEFLLALDLARVSPA